MAQYTNWVVVQSLGTYRVAHPETGRDTNEHSISRGVQVAIHIWPRCVRFVRTLFVFALGSASGASYPIRGNGQMANLHP